MVGAADGLDPVTVDVHGHRVAAVVTRAAKGERHHLVAFVGAFDQLPVVPANPVMGLEDPPAAGRRHGAALGLKGRHQAHNERGRRPPIARFWDPFSGIARRREGTGSGTLGAPLQQRTVPAGTPAPVRGAPSRGARIRDGEG